MSSNTTGTSSYYFAAQLVIPDAAVLTGRCGSPHVSGGSPFRLAQGEIFPGTTGKGDYGVYVTSQKNTLTEERRRRSVFIQKSLNVPNKTLKTVFLSHMAFMRGRSTGAAGSPVEMWAS